MKEKERIAKLKSELADWKFKYRMAVNSVKEDGLDRILGAMEKMLVTEQAKLRKAHVCRCPSDACKLMRDKYHLALMDKTRKKDGK